MEKSVFDILSLVLSVITPVMVLIMGWIYIAHQKKSEKIEKLETKVDDSEANKLKKQLATIEDLCRANSSAVDALNRVVRELSAQQNQLQISNKVNGKCTRELAYLVTALSEGLRDNHLDGNITSAVNRYKKFEHDILGQIMAGDENANTILNQ